MNKQTNTQPEALRLADLLVQAPATINLKYNAAAELRRLHEGNQMLVEALDEAVDYIGIQDTVKKQELRKIIAKAKEQT